MCVNCQGDPGPPGAVGPPGISAPEQPDWIERVKRIGGRTNPEPDAEQRAEAVRLVADEFAYQAAHGSTRAAMALEKAHDALLAAEAEVAELQGYRDEAERLRLIEHRKMYDEIEMLEARVKRLKEALDVIANDRVGFRSYSEVFSYARAALSEPTEE